jgi:S1-C subfamily serine protease
VLTNEHVVRAAGTPLQVRTADGAQLEARVVAQDPERDLAALSTGSLPQGAHVFAFAESVSVGTEVAVLGHPRQSAGWVLTPGHVSSTSERFASESGQPQPAFMYTCPTRQGSSGSPVLLADGRVAAVHCAGRAGELLGAAGQALGGARAATELTGFALGIPAGAARDFVAGLPTP